MTDEVFGICVLELAGLAFSVVADDWPTHNVLIVG